MNNSMDPNDEVGGEVRSQIGPWGMVPVWVFPYLTPGEFKVYAALRTYADRSGYCRPTTKTIAERAGVAIGSTRNAIQHMRAYGLLETQERRRPDGSIAGLDFYLVDMDPQTLEQLELDRGSSKKSTSKPKIKGGVPSRSDWLPPAETQNNLSTVGLTGVHPTIDPNRTHHKNTPLKSFKDSGEADASPGERDENSTPDAHQLGFGEIVEEKPTPKASKAKDALTGRGIKGRKPASDRRERVKRSPEDISPTERLTTAHYDRLGGLTNYIAAFKIIDKAVKTGYAEQHINQALMFIEQQNWQLTAQRLGIQLRGGPRRAYGAPAPSMTPQGSFAPNHPSGKYVEM